MTAVILEEDMKRNSDIKALIQEASERLFEKHGYKKTSVNLITKEAGIAKGTFFNYYPTKGHLIFEKYVEKTGSIDINNLENITDSKEALIYLIENTFFKLINLDKEFIRVSYLAVLEDNDLKTMMRNIDNQIMEKIYLCLSKNNSVELSNKYTDIILGYCFYLFMNFFSDIDFTKELFKSKVLDFIDLIFTSGGMK